MYICTSKGININGRLGREIFIVFLPPLRVRVLGRLLRHVNIYILGSNLEKGILKCSDKKEIYSGDESRTVHFPIRRFV